MRFVGFRGQARQSFPIMHCARLVEFMNICVGKPRLHSTTETESTT